MKVGFDGVLTIEHEDGVNDWNEVPPSEVGGLVAGLRHLGQYGV